jgi:hypothetical protein
MLPIIKDYDMLLKYDEIIQEAEEMRKRLIKEFTERVFVGSHTTVLDIALCLERIANLARLGRESN